MSQNEGNISGHLVAFGLILGLCATFLPQTFAAPDVEPTLALSGGTGGMFTVPDVQVEETREAYIVKIPIKQPEDARQVKVEASPHRIQVSGKKPLTAGNGQVIGSTSFFRSYTPQVEIQPKSLKRTVQGHFLKVMLLKKTPSHPTATPQGPEQPETTQQPLSPQLREQLKQQAKDFI